MEYRANAFSPEGFRPEAAPDYTPGFDRNAQVVQRSIQNEIDGLRSNLSAELYNAEQSGADLMELGKFSKTLLEFTEEQTKRYKEDQRINELYDFLVAPGEQQPLDAEIVERGEAEADVASTVQSRVEGATADPVMSEQARNVVATPLANAVVSERGQLLRAQVSYGAYMQSYLGGNDQFVLDGQKLSVRQAVASGDTRLINSAIANGRSKFIRENGLAGVSKKQFVKILGPTILQADASIGGAVARNAVEARRKQQRLALEGTGYGIGSNSSASTVGESWRSLSDTMWLSGSYSSRGEANQAALESILKGLAAKGDVDAIESLNGIEKIPGQPKTRLGLQYGELIDRYEEKARQQEKAIDSQTFDQVEGEMYRQLSALGENATPEQRAAVIDSAADKLEAAGLYKKARELRGQGGELMTDAESDFNYQNMLSGINNGTVTESDITKAELRGDISTSQASNLRSAFNRSPFGEAAVMDQEAKDIVKDQSKRFEADFLVAAGLKRDPSGNILPLPEGQEGLVSPGEARVVIGKAQRELRKAIATALQQNPGIKGIARTKLINDTANEWWSLNVESPNGRFSFRDVKETGRKISYKKSARDRFRAIVDSAEPTDARFLPQGIKPVDFSGETKNGTVVSDTVVARFRPLRGDKLFSLDQVEEIRDAYLNGDIDERLSRNARRLGMSEIGLLNQQLGAYRKPGISSDTRTTSERVNLKSMGVSDAGVEALTRHGYTARSARTIQGSSPMLWRKLSSPYSTKRQLDEAFEEAGLNFIPVGDGKERTVQVGKHLLTRGFKPWQHKDFNVDSGYTGSGNERVMQRSYNSAHHHGEALDYPLSHNSAQELDQLYAYLRANEKRFGISELLWRTHGHHDHLHVGFIQ